MKKIMLVALYKVFSQLAGAERVFWNMANDFSLYEDFEVTAVGFDEEKVDIPYDVLPNVKYINLGEYKNNFSIELQSLFYINKDKRHKFRRIYKDNSIGRKLEPIIKEKKPDIIISFQPEITYIIKECMNINTIPVVTMFHNEPNRTLDVDLENREEWYGALEKCECIQVLNENFIDIIKKYIHNKNIIYIPNIVPQYDDQKVLNYDIKKIINVARLERNQKRQHLLIEAFNLIKSKYNDWTVEFWGYSDEEYLRELKNLVDKYELKNNIRFCGTSKNISEKLCRASIFAFPSAYEGFPLALTEAMSMGLPVVTYKNVLGVNGIVKDNYNGLLCDDSVESFANALDRLMSDKILRMRLGKNGKEEMRNYSKNIINDRWRCLIIDIINNNI